MRKMHALSHTDTNTHRHTHVAKTDRGEGRCWLSKMYREEKEKIWNETDCQRSKKSRPKPIEKVQKKAVYYDKTQHVKNALEFEQSDQPPTQPKARMRWKPTYPWLAAVFWPGPGGSWPTDRRCCSQCRRPAAQRCRGPCSCSASCASSSASVTPGNMCYQPTEAVGREGSLQLSFTSTTPGNTCYQPTEAVGREGSLQLSFTSTTPGNTCYQPTEAVGRKGSLQLSFTSTAYLLISAAEFPPTPHPPQITVTHLQLNYYKLPIWLPLSVCSSACWSVVFFLLTLATHHR